MNFQDDVKQWVTDCFGGTTMQERTFRFLEEALECAQAAGCTEDEAKQLVAYVFERPTGELRQEVGGTMTTLAALCAEFKLDMMQCAWDELRRNQEKMESIRAKRLMKPDLSSPLP